MGYRTLAQFRQEVLRQVKKPLAGAGIYDADQAINGAYLEVSQYADWPWLKTRYDIPLVAPYTTGTVSATIGSTTVTGVGTTWDVAWFNREILIGNGYDGLVIAQVTSPTTLTLAQAYSGASNVTGSAYSLYQQSYPMPANYSVGRDIAMYCVNWRLGRLTKVDSYTLLDRIAMVPALAASQPTVYCNDGVDPWPTSPTYRQMRFRFWPRPSAVNRLRVEYYQVPVLLATDGDMSVMPQEFDDVLLLLACYKLKKLNGVPGWLDDQTKAMQTLLQMREKVRADKGNDYGPSLPFYWDDPATLDAWSVWAGPIGMAPTP